MSGQRTPTSPPPSSNMYPVLPTSPGGPRSPRAASRNTTEARLASPDDKVVNNVSSQQAKILEDNFKQNKNMDEITLEIVAAEAGLSPEDAARWFQNRKAIWRRNEGLSPNSRTLEEM
ncbi:homeodomain-only protein-like [Asterias rubens]|uniref:homeodomain-only protein-like n=1 Tax=Asterias rubens TaxID=7604 RepID=UPI001455188D|nr:homeodomain-only protein-like [Asterias rubens]